MDERIPNYKFVLKRYLPRIIFCIFAITLGVIIFLQGFKVEKYIFAFILFVLGAGITFSIMLLLHNSIYGAISYCLCYKKGAEVTLRVTNKKKNLGYMVFEYTDINKVDYICRFLFNRKIYKSFENESTVSGYFYKDMIWPIL